MHKASQVFFALGIAVKMVCPERQTIGTYSPTRRGTPQKENPVKPKKGIYRVF
jgi:hypothetical protein